MTRSLLGVALAAALAAGCGGDDRKAIPPAGPMTPPGAGAEQEGGGAPKAGGKKVNANTAEEK